MPVPVTSPTLLRDLVADGEKTLLVDPEGDSNYADQRGDPCDASFGLTAGHHRLRFVYRHGGTGYIDHFNGVRLRDLRIETTSEF